MRSRRAAIIAERETRRRRDAIALAFSRARGALKPTLRALFLTYPYYALPTLPVVAFKAILHALLIPYTLSDFISVLLLPWLALRVLGLTLRCFWVPLLFLVPHPKRRRAAPPRGSLEEPGAGAGGHDAACPPGLAAPVHALIDVDDPGLPLSAWPRRLLAMARLCRAPVRPPARVGVSFVCCTLRAARGGRSRGRMESLKRVVWKAKGKESMEGLKEVFHVVGGEGVKVVEEKETGKVRRSGGDEDGQGCGAERWRRGRGRMRRATAASMFAGAGQAASGRQETQGDRAETGGRENPAVAEGDEEAGRPHRSPSHLGQEGRPFRRPHKPRGV